MGFNPLKIVRDVARPAGTVLGAISGGIPGALIGSALGGAVSGPEQEPYMAEEDARNKAYEDMKKGLADQSEAATRYRTQLPALQQERASRGDDSIRQQMAQQMSGVNQSMNRRGLLHSGLRQGQQMDVQAAGAGEMARNRSNINQETNARANQMDMDIAQQGLSNQQTAQDAANSAYDIALKKRAGNQQAGQGVFGLLGGALGKVFS